MRNKNLIALQKMADYCDNILQDCKGLSYEAFIADRRRLTACSFALLQLGELASKLDQSVKDLSPKIPWHLLRGVRNRIVHDYDSVELRTLWNMLTQDIAPLKTMLAQALATLESLE